MKQETNRLIRAWIWFWYNDVTRFLGVMCGLHLLFTVLPMIYFGIPKETIQNIALFQYFVIFAWAIIDNNYNNLNRIGLDAYRRTLKR